MLSFIKKTLSRSPYTPLITVRISRENILHNLGVFADAVAPATIAPVLKANAYGHGLVEVARILDGDSRVAFLIVDSLFEARVLRESNIRVPLLVAGYTRPADIITASNQLDDVAFTIATSEQVRTLSQLAQKPLRIHVKVNTGMNRQGLAVGELKKALADLSNNPHIIIDGFFTHLASADAPHEDEFTLKQIGHFKEARAMVERLRQKPRFIHVSNTAGTRFANILDTNVFRLGLGLYGISPMGESDMLKPALSMHTIATNIRTLERMETIGYNRTFTVYKPITTALIPVGYYEGLDRRLSNKGSVRIKNVTCPIAGRVSMNMTTIDVTAVPNVREGDEVEVISADATAPNSVNAIAALCETVAHDTTVHIPAHLRRDVI